MTGGNKFCITDENRKRPLAFVSLSEDISKMTDAPKAEFWKVFNVPEIKTNG